MTSSTAEWLKWAKTAGINDLVSAYLTQYPEQLLVIDPNNEDLAPHATCLGKSFRNLDQLQALDQKMQKELAADIFSGDLGDEVGWPFAQFVLAQGQELTVGNPKDAKDGKEQFENADEANQNSSITVMAKS